MAESLRIAVNESSQTAEARRTARAAARRAGMDEKLEEQVAIVVTEACTNLLKHASGGELLINSASSERPGALPAFEVLALDQGPGMADLEKCLRDGYSTGGSPGQGLGAIRRLSTLCDIYSIAGRGTALLARWPEAASQAAKTHPGPSLSVGAVNVSKPGQEVCGDSWGMACGDSVCTLLVADGLGHGPEANRASAQAVRILRDNPGIPPVTILERVHLALRSTRGAAVAVAQIDPRRATLAFAGVGNIAAQIYRNGFPSQHLVSSNGTAGMQIPKVREFAYPWPPDGILVLNSDGLSTSAGIDKQHGLAMRDPTLIAGVLYRDFSRHSDDATVVVVKAA
ncbi:MAG: ATP-binding protein [Candidatus Solibacter sp.]